VLMMREQVDNLGPVRKRAGRKGHCASELCAKPPLRSSARARRARRGSGYQEHAFCPVVYAIYDTPREPKPPKQGLKGEGST
jgi:hypothetical protein